MSEFEAKILQKAGVLCGGQKTFCGSLGPKVVPVSYHPSGSKIPRALFAAAFGVLHVKLCGRSIDNWTATQRLSPKKSSKIIGVSFMISWRQPIG